MMHGEILEALHAAAEPDYARFAAGLLPDNTHPLLGVRLPILRRLAQRIARSPRAEKFLKREPSKRATFEEIMLHGLVPGYMPGIPARERMGYIDRIVPRLDNWSLCDSCCATYGFAAEEKDAAWEWLLPYTRMQGEYLRRFGIVMMLDHFVPDAAWAARVAEVLPGVPTGAKYCDLAAAWCACEICLCHPGLAETLLAAQPECIRKLTQRKIRESRRSQPQSAANLAKSQAPMKFRLEQR